MGAASAAGGPYIFIAGAVAGVVEGLSIQPLVSLKICV